MRLTRRQLRRIIQESVSEGKFIDKIKNRMDRAKRLANDTAAINAAYKDKENLEPVKTVKETMEAIVAEAPDKRALGQCEILGDIGMARIYAKDDARQKLGSGRIIASEVSADGIYFVVMEK